MSAPGSGKTRTILRTIAELQAGLRFGVIEADIDSKVDAEAVAAEGISAVQINTGGFCHLDDTMVAKGLDQLELAEPDAGIIENVGPEMLVYASDYPHPEGTSDPIRKFEAEVKECDQKTMEAFYYGNMAEWLGLPA